MRLLFTYLLTAPRLGPSGTPLTLSKLLSLGIAQTSLALPSLTRNIVKLKLQSSQATLVRVALFGKKRSSLLISLIVNNIALKGNLVLRFVKEELSRSD